MSCRHMVRSIAGIFILALLLGCEEDLIIYNVDLEIQQLMTEYNLPSVSACVIKEQEIVWSHSSGYSNIEDRKAASETTIYHVGSISKLFVVTAIMQLEEQGLIDIDKDISHYLSHKFRHPGFKEIPISTRMLLTHRSGLAWPKSYNSTMGMWNEFEPDHAPSPSEWIPQFLVPDGENYNASLWKSIKPGEYEFYSNIGTCVIAYLVEALTSMNFREYCKEHIFKPLNMHNTSFNYADLDQHQIARMYGNEGDSRSAFDNRVYAAGGLKTTILDLSHFAMSYLNGGYFDGVRILKESTIGKILQIQNEASGRCLIWKAVLGDWFVHTGGLELGAASTLEINRESKIALLIFTNTHSSLVYPGNRIHSLVRQKANEYR